ncbi:hypothetical protein ACJTM1_09340 [Bacillus sp. GX]|uniref:hypothetical protein n=1 Tax=Bacillus sp. GX TaxID=3382157 RepID=UPI0038CC1A77
MNEKNYSIAAPSLFINEKNHIVSVSPGLSYEKTYCISISIANPFGENERKFPVSMPPNSRVKAVKEDSPGVFATKINRIKGVFSDVINQASREIEVEANMVTLNNFDMDRHVDLAISETQNSKQSRSFAINITDEESAQQHSRIFNMEHVTEELADKPFDTHEITIVNESIMSRTTGEYEINEVIEEEILYKKIREFATDVEELPEWVKIARVLYGERFYESILADRKEKELQSSMFENDTGEIVMKELPAVTTNHLEMADRCIHEVAASYEEYDLFSDQGIPVYLPDYDLFARIQRELKATYAKFDSAERNIIQVDGGSISFEEAERQILEIKTRSTVNETFKRKNLSLELTTFDMESLQRTENEVLANMYSYEHMNRVHTYYESASTEETQSTRITNEYIANSIKQLESMDNTTRELAVNISDGSEMFDVNREFIAGKIIEFDKSSRNNKPIQTVIDKKAAAKIIAKEIKSECSETLSFNKKTKEIVTCIAEGNLSKREGKEITTLEETLSVADRNIKEIAASKEEMDLFDGMGRPVYLPDYDLFARTQRELQAMTVLSDIMDRSKVIITSEIVDTIDMERCTPNIMTDVSEIIDFKRPTLELDTQITNDYDAADTLAKQSLIQELDTFDRNVSVATEIEEIERFNRDICIKSSVEEFEPFEKVLEIDTEIIESDRFIINKFIATECIQFDDFLVNNIYPTEIIEVDENRKVQKEEPKLWLRHSRASWWTNSNWKKTR